MVMRFVSMLSLALILGLGTNYICAQEGKQDLANPEAVDTTSDVSIKVIRALISAFNDHDPSEMVKQVDPEIELYYVDGTGKSEKSLSSSRDLEKEMAGYFQAIPDVKSTIEGCIVVGRFVSVHEKVEWTRENKKFSQYSLSVYEMRSDKIRRVWYYTSQK